MWKHLARSSECRRGWGLTLPELRRAARAGDAPAGRSACGEAAAAVRAQLGGAGEAAAETALSMAMGGFPAEALRDPAAAAGPGRARVLRSWLGGIVVVGAECGGGGLKQAWDCMARAFVPGAFDVAELARAAQVPRGSNRWSILGLGLYFASLSHYPPPHRHTHTDTHARTHARTHAHTHMHTHSLTFSLRRTRILRGDSRP
jgi:hypothetical protein